MGYIGKALEKGFSDMYGLGGGGLEPCFSENWLLPLEIFCLFWSAFRQTAPHPYPHYQVRFGWGGG